MFTTEKFDNSKSPVACFEGLGSIFRDVEKTRTDASCVEDRVGISSATTALSRGLFVGEGEQSAVCPLDRQLAKSNNLFGGEVDL
jgi:hypothetical protein